MRLVTLAMASLVGPFSATAWSATVNWTFTGEINDVGVFQTFAIGDAYTMTVSLDDTQTGTQTGFNTQYVGTATFSSDDAGYYASDTTARISIADSPNLMTISLLPPDAVMPDLEYTNLPGQFKEVADININLDFAQAIGSEDITDYLNLAAFDFDSKSGNVRTTSSVPPSFTVDTISSSVVPVPAAAWLFGSALGLLGRLRRRKS